MRQRHASFPLWPGILAVVIVVAAIVSALLIARWVSREEPSPEFVTGPLPAAPAGWPARLELGMANVLEAAPVMRRTAPFAFRYQYLAGGVHDSWVNWKPGGSFVPLYVRESVANGMTPVFTYYMLLQSSPGEGNEDSRIRHALADRDLMRAYLEDVRRFFQEAAKEPQQRVILHIEPDLWGYLQKRAGSGGATSLPAQVAGTGMPELAGLPDTAAGLARAFAVLRDRYAPNVILAYSLSNWANGDDITYGSPSNSSVDAAAAAAVAFYRSLGTRFDLTFAEFSDRDAGFKAAVYHDGGGSWWSPETFQRHARFLGQFVRGSGLRAVLWQIPYGNTRMRAVNNTANHYQDNRVEWLLDGPAENLDVYLQAGVIGLLFGRGADGATDASDAARDGVTNPEPINGNLRTSLTADDDGGYFRERAAIYYSGGPRPLP